MLPVISGSIPSLEVVVLGLSTTYPLPGINLNTGVDRGGRRGKFHMHGVSVLEQ